MENTARYTRGGGTEGSKKNRKKFWNLKNQNICYVTVLPSSLFVKKSRK